MSKGMAVIIIFSQFLASRTQWTHKICPLQHFSVHNKDHVLVYCVQRGTNLMSKGIAVIIFFIHVK